MTDKYRKTLALYKRFATEKRIRWLDKGFEIYNYLPPYDFSDKAGEELFDYESKGVGSLSSGIFNDKPNGYLYGKRMMDITIGMWKEDLGTTIFKDELIKDYGKEFIEKVL